VAEATHRLGPYSVTVADDFGPRVLGFRPEEGPEMLVRLSPQTTLESPAGTVHLRGGHRLWVAPELPQLTHVPDDEPCQVEADDEHLRIRGPVDAAGFTKELELWAQEGSLVVEHRLHRSAPEPVEAAPWGITQLPPGGFAILPVGGRSGSSHQADRSLVLWPYSSLSDERLTLHEHAILIAARGGPQTKFGAGPDPGRLGYLRQGWLFTKSVTPADGDASYADRGAVGQVYVNDSFCELESLGRLTVMSEGEVAVHRETWQAVECDSIETALSLTLGEETA
jgi:hypothetical protein